MWAGRLLSHRVQWNFKVRGAANKRRFSWGEWHGTENFQGWFSANYACETIDKLRNYYPTISLHCVIFFLGLQAPKDYNGEKKEIFIALRVPGESAQILWGKGVWGNMTLSEATGRWLIQVKMLNKTPSHLELLVRNENIDGTVALIRASQSWKHL